MDKCWDEGIGGWVGGWHGWMDGWMDGWVGGWVKVWGEAQAAQAYSLYFVWNFGSERFIRLCMGI